MNSVSKLFLHSETYCSNDWYIFNDFYIVRFRVRLQGRNEVCGIRDQRGGIKDQRDQGSGITVLGSGITDHGIGISSFLGIRGQVVPYLWDQGRKWVTLLESRIRNLRTKMGSGKKKHTSLPPCDWVRKLNTIELPHNIFNLIAFNFRTIRT